MGEVATSPGKLELPKRVVELPVGKLQLPWGSSELPQGACGEVGNSELPRGLGTSPGKFAGAGEVELPHGSWNFRVDVLTSGSGTNFPGEEHGVVSWREVLTYQWKFPGVA